MARTLVIVLCQEREFAENWELFQRHVQQPLDADLAFCGAFSSDSSQDTSVIRMNATHLWERPEPQDWLAELDSWEGNNTSWRQLVDLGPMFLGGTGLHDSVGSGALIMYWREVLRVSLPSRLLNQYDWFAITRSDFRWLAPHPSVDLLDSAKVYLLDGEQYGGVSDRHIIFHRSTAPEILSVAEPIFAQPTELKDRLLSSGVSDLNPERFIKFRLDEMGLGDRLVFLPYLGFTVRHESTQTRWSVGSFNRKLGYFVKYPEELRKARVTARHIKEAGDWEAITTSRPSGRRWLMRFDFALSGELARLRGRCRRMRSKLQGIVLKSRNS